MKKLNEKSTLPLNSLVVALVLAGVTVLAFLIGWYTMASLAGGFAILSFGIFLFAAVEHSIHVGRQAIALSILPDLLPPVSSAAGLFDARAVPQVNREPPTMVNDVRSFFSNEKALSDHLIYLERIQRQVREHLPRALRRYKDDRDQLERQQLALYRMAHQATKQAAALERAFPLLRAELEAVPHPPPLPTLPPPSAITEAEYDKRMSDIAVATGNVLGRAVVAGAQGNTGMAILGFFAAAVGNVIQFQSNVRQMHVAHGEVKVFAARAAQELDQLGRSHAEAVHISQTVYERSAHARQLLLWVKNARANGTLSPNATLSAEGRAAIISLKQCAMLDRIQTARAV
jgi:hypothetical protein